MRLVRPLGRGTAVGGNGPRLSVGARHRKGSARGRGIQTEERRLGITASHLEIRMGESTFDVNAVLRTKGE